MSDLDTFLTLDVEDYIAHISSNCSCENVMVGTITIQPQKVVRRHKKYFITVVDNPTLKTEQEIDTFTVTRDSIYDNNTFQFVAYPNNANHAKIFSTSYVRAAGPQERFPGSIAAIKVKTSPQEFQFVYAQYCFKVESPQQLTRSLASRYMGAQNRLIDIALDQYSGQKEFDLAGVTPFEYTHNKILDQIKKRHTVKEEWWGLECIQ